jgi:rhamnose utilization protein RhaD (predicted bifunctional aldolase and dehydrogenase)
MADARIPELIALIRALATHPARPILGSEGSAALKVSEDRFAVTPRGANLPLLEAETVCEVSLPRMLELAATEALPEGAIDDAVLYSGGATPSADALLYAFLLSFEGIRFAVHVHPMEVNQITASPRARQFSDRRTLPHEVLVCGSASLLVPYADPGLALAREVQRRMILWRDRYKVTPKLVLVQNHGMFVLAPAAEQIIAIVEMTVKAAQTFIGAAMLGGPVFLTPNNVSSVEAMKEL